MMRVGIIGAGVIGTVHARLIDSLADRAKLAAVVDLDQEKAAALADRYGATAYTELADALADPEVTAYSVCVPSGLHPEVAAQVINAGKSVLVEKPLAITMDGADQVAEAAQEAGVTVGVVSQRRFQPAARCIRSAIDDGLLGRLTSAVVESPLWRSQEYYESGDWRGTLTLDGGGALMNQGIHALDLMIWLMGRPVCVSAHSGCIAHTDIEVEDVVGATITFESGAIGVFLATTAANPGLPIRLAFHGDGGVIVMDDERITQFTTTVTDSPPTPPSSEAAESIDAAHRAQYADFLQAIGDHREPFVTVADGRLSLQVVLAIYESARTGRPVELPAGK
ncbi:Gfo/Idh/MocA family protein [Microlunatus sp. Gsoil 973]|uniref:Gfo/Idh/MocA family protein n=1 Tax=Microlunatus sp. Gsoil 973 TaxID=2672569 RepID=UPI0012B4ED3C|nr:Gfo/Idh/MocA family oxidoreductase [Microlunatus sp. Gsoil 973]QGN34185.1 gfo/Idh/MocA family oxidoreductase [Microlunatus sp. Gsoil 973]